MLKITRLITHYIAEERLPSAYLDVALKWFKPLCDSFALHHDKSKNSPASLPSPYFIGINGCQGSGKSTLSGLMCYLLNEYYGKACIVLSLDDFYHTKAERISLSQKIHPMLAVRGVPGTHDTQLLRGVLHSLSLGKPVDVPTFDKSIDERAPINKWQRITSSIDFVIVEGWCWGTQAQSTKDLVIPINTLEKTQDSQGIWRRYVNQAIKNRYTPLYKYMNTWVFLKAPSFDSVYAWRRQQEEKLRRRVGNASHIMSNEEILTFIQYYQRLTVHTLCTLEESADFIFELDNERNITKSRYHAK